MKNSELVAACRELIEAYKRGDLGQTVMPEDQNPGFSNEDIEIRIAYFTLPMALNYQRNSYDLWKAALKTYNDTGSRKVFDIEICSKLSKDDLRNHLLKYKLALQPNKHVDTWYRIAQTVYNNWGSFVGLLVEIDYDYLKLRRLVQVDYKKDFPYLSGPKIFNYWTFILNSYCGANLKNSHLIDIAPDTHITKCSIKLGVISEKEAVGLSKEEISARWKLVLSSSNINPIDMHPPLWFWSRNGFVYDIKVIDK